MSHKPAIGIWLSVDDFRFFALPIGFPLHSEGIRIVSLAGETRTVSAQVLQGFEVTEQDALRWVREELGAALDELKAGIDGVLAGARQRVDERNHEPVRERTSVTPDAGGALLALLGKLPGVIGNSLSGDAGRVAAARETLAGLDDRLRDAGIRLDERFTGFADRLARLREPGGHEPGLREQTRPRP